jgi:hypothetical protein
MVNMILVLLFQYNFNTTREQYNCSYVFPTVPLPYLCNQTLPSQYHHLEAFQIAGPNLFNRDQLFCLKSLF